ncbi:MAG: phosphoenolpyruvate carboxykinase (ATP) [Saprospiraceae bacterium]|nr:phosphoenolpyruvate carboxykinase (ATP) [Saprospiraceae bacterium]
MQAEIANPKISELELLGITAKNIYFNLSAEELTQKTLEINEGVITDSGALSIKTGKYTGRAPKDRFIVSDSITENKVDWNSINKKISKPQFLRLKEKVAKYLSNQTLYIKEGQACSDDQYKLNVRLVAEKPWSAQFVHNMFLRPSKEQLESFQPDWNILCAPGFNAIPEIDGTRSENFAILCFSEKTIIIGGTGYTGEIKKGIFSALNFILPLQEEVLSMHCSANVGQKGDTAIFFGLSGTGKTTLSTDSNRALIGDDEHGWSREGVFNFEGGCYAKCINLSKEKEPEIYSAIKPGAILENIGFIGNTNIPDFSKAEITQNTRVSYPIHHIENIQEGSKGNHPNHIFFLTCDAYGVLPPVSKLTRAQAMYHFISGYTAKVAGTEEGVSEPEATFSACFGAPFLPLHPTKYAEMLGDKMDKHNVSVWLINTGWTEGAFPQGHRIKLPYTRAIINAVLEGKLSNIEFENTEIFNLAIPKECEGVPSMLLNPKNTWKDKLAYEDKAMSLASLFIENFDKYKTAASSELLNAAPQPLTSVVI